MNNARDTLIYVFWFICVHISVGYILRNRIAELRVYVCSTSVDAVKHFPKGLNQFTPSLAVSVAPHLHQYLVLSVF